MNDDMRVKMTETISYFSEKNTSLISFASHTSEGEKMDSGMDKPHTAMQTNTNTKDKKIDESKERGHDYTYTLARLNQNHMWLHTHVVICSCNCLTFQLGD